MSEDARIDRLAEALEAIIADPRAPLRPADAELAELLRIAQDLHDLPRPAFKARLGADLLRRATMTSTTDKTAPEAIQSVTAYLAVRPAVELIDFVKRAFGAEGAAAHHRLRPGGVHAEVRIGDTKVMIGGGGAWSGTPTPTGLHLYVPDADQVYRHALEAGAESLYAPVDQPYGDREAGVRDLAGNHWYIATHQAGGHVPAGLGSVTPFLHPRGAPGLIDFLRQAFAAEELEIASRARGRPSRTPRSAWAARSSRWARPTASGDRCPPCSTCTWTTWTRWYRRAPRPARRRWRSPRSSPTASAGARCATPSTTSGTWPRPREDRR